jgi:hypothetical protein
MFLLAYVDGRPYLFVAGIPFVLVIAWFLVRTKLLKGYGNAISIGLAVYVVAFLGIFAGPLVDQTSTREYTMTWSVAPEPSQGLSQSEVILTFVDYPGHSVGEFSDKLAAHLQTQGQPTVRVSVELTKDFGQVRSFRLTEIAGLRHWQAEYGYSASRGDQFPSPW